MTSLTTPTVGIRAWLRDLSYEEIHAIEIGFAIAFLAAVSNSSALLSAYITILLWALGIRGFPTRNTTTGDPKRVDHTPEYEQRVEMYHDLEQISNRAYSHHHPPPPEFTSPHIELLRQIRREPHYYIGGGLLGDRLGAALYYYYNDTWPTIYDDLPGVVDLLLGVVPM